MFGRARLKHRNRSLGRATRLLGDSMDTTQPIGSQRTFQERSACLIENATDLGEFTGRYHLS